MYILPTVWQNLISFNHLALSAAGPRRWTLTTPRFPPNSGKGQHQSLRRCWSPGLHRAAGPAWCSAPAADGLSPNGWRAPDLSWLHMPSPGCPLDAQWPLTAGWRTWASLKNKTGQDKHVKPALTPNIDRTTYNSEDIKLHTLRIKMQKCLKLPNTYFMRPLLHFKFPHV